MLKPPNRPRAPSAATLRVLYQLAYISSGTALGVGALCAEERRRRTQVVQKIADNARRLHQHPRYRHNAALAAVGGEDGFQYEMLAHRSGLENVQDGVSLGPELPSVIESAYAYTSGYAEREARSKRRRTRVQQDQRAGPDAQLQGDTAIGHQQLGAHFRPMQLDELDALSDYETRPKYVHQPIDVLSERSFASNTGSRLRSNHRPPSSDDQPANVRTISQEGPIERSHIARSKRSHRSVAQSLTSLEPPPSQNVLLRRGGQPKTGLIQTNSHMINPMWSKFKTRKFWAHSQDPTFWKTLDSADKLEVSQWLSNDVDLLFVKSKLSQDKEPVASLEEFEEVARVLLHLARPLGHLKIATTLLLWKIAVARVSNADLEVLNKTYTVSKFRGKAWEIAVRDGDKLTTFRPLYGNSALPGGTSDSRESDSFKAGPHVLMQTAMTKESSLRWTLSTSQICTAVIETCRDLARMNHLGSAIYIMTAVPLRDWASDTINQLAQEFFRAAVQSTQLDLCDLLFRWTSSCAPNGCISDADVNAYIGACGIVKAYGLLSASFNDPSYKDSANAAHLAQSKTLSMSSFRQLCNAFSSGPTQSQVCYDACYQQLSDEQRELLHLRAADDVAANLMTIWSTKHNFELAAQHFTTSMTSSDETSARSLRLTMIRICLAAGETSYAKEVFAELSKVDNDDTDAFLATMLACANASDWNGVQGLLELGVKAAVTELHTHTIKQILQYYAHQHSSMDVLDLGVRVLEATGLAPDSVVSTFILQQAAAEERHDVFSKWFDVCKEHQWKVDVDSRLAAALLHKHAVTKRPNHMMTMGTAYTMSALAPALYTPRIKDVVKEAISYDMRAYRHRRAKGLLKNAEMRLEHLLSLPGQVAHPGAIWNKEPVLKNHAKLAAPKNGPMIDDLKLESISNEAGELASKEDIMSYSLSLSNDSHDDLELAPVRSVSTSENTKPGTTKLSTFHSDMLLALSSERYRDVMSLYRRSIDVYGAPRSIMSLEMALEASLRLHQGNDEEVKNMLAEAQSFGMYTGSAIGPLLMHRMKQRSRITPNEVDDIMKAVMGYYRLRAQSGRPASHLLAVATADKLITDGLPEEGARILQRLVGSDWTKKKALDVVALTVWIKAYVYLRDITSICNLVQYILTTRIQISHILIWTLKMAERYPSAITKLPADRFTEEERKRLRDCYQRCLQRQVEQKAQTSRYLPKLAFSMVERWHDQHGIAWRGKQGARQGMMAAQQRMDAPLVEQAA